MIFNGDGGHCDPVEGCKWLALASAQGVKTEMFALAAGMMSEDEIAEAKKLALDWKATRPASR